MGCNHGGPYLLQLMSSGSCNLGYRMKIIKIDTRLEAVFKTLPFEFDDAGSIRKITCAAITYIRLFEKRTGHLTPPNCLLFHLTSS